MLQRMAKRKEEEEEKKITERGLVSSLYISVWFDEALPIGVRSIDGFLVDCVFFFFLSHTHIQIPHMYCTYCPTVCVCSTPATMARLLL